MLVQMLLRAIYNIIIINFATNLIKLNLVGHGNKNHDNNTNTVIQIISIFYSLAE